MANGGRVTEALQKIGNSNSIPVLELAFNLSCEPQVNTSQDNWWLANKRCSIMYVVASFPAEDSLRLILRLLEQAEAASGQAPVSYGNRTLSEVAARMLTHQNDPAKEDQWRQIVGNFPKKTLPPKQREFLESAIRQKEPEK
jgi:hypothetical protein